MAYEKQFWEYEPSGHDDEIDRLEVDKINLKKRVKELEIENSRMKDWLWQYREELKSTNVFHKNEAIIHAINKIIP